MAANPAADSQGGRLGGDELWIGSRVAYLFADIRAMWVERRKTRYEDMLHADTGELLELYSVAMGAVAAEKATIRGLWAPAGSVVNTGDC